jgi:hypothetical protein
MKWNKACFRMPGRVALTYGLGIAVVLCEAGAVRFASAAQQEQEVEQLSDALRLSYDLTTFVVEVKTHKSSNKQNNVDPAQNATPDVFSRGDTFVVDGTIYSKGSIQEGPGQEPLSSARKLGSYVQRGVFTVDVNEFLQAIGGAKDVSSHIGFVSELLSFQDGSTILLDGLWPNANFTIERVVLGGTGRFREAVGTVFETNIGEDKDGFCNLRLRCKIRKRSSGRHDR